MKIRAVTYNRCSTDEEKQKNALQIQVAESREHALAQGWEVVDQYIEAESGTSSVHRSEYQRLLKDLSSTKFEIIIIKSIDRLCRRQLDWYTFLEKAEQHKKKIYLYLERRFISDADTILNSIEAMFAEHFSAQLSSKIKNSHKRRRELKTYTNITCEIFGWDRIGPDEFIINEEEANFYRQAFLLAEQGNGFYTIANKMAEAGAISKNGKVISNVQWRNLLYSPRAHGTVILHQSEYNYKTRKRKMLPESEWITCEGALPPIITKEYQEHVIKILQTRASKGRDISGDSTEAKKKRNPRNMGKYELSGRITCGICGSTYYRSEVKSNMGTMTEWKCSNLLKHGRGEKPQGGGEKPHGCNNINILEDELISIISETCKDHINELFPSNEDIIRKVLELIRTTLTSRDPTINLKNLEQKLERLNSNQRTLILKLLDGIVSDKSFKDTSNAIQRKIEDTEKQIEILKSKNNTIENRLLSIEKFLRDGEHLDRIKAKQFIETVSKITVYPNSQLKIELIRSTYLNSAKDLQENITTTYTHRTNKIKSREANKEKILEIVKRNPQASIEEMRASIGMSKTYTYNLLSELKKEGVHYKSKGAENKKE